MLISNTCLFQGCDEFTNNFLRKLGVRVNQPRETPADPYTTHRKEVSICAKANQNRKGHNNVDCQIQRCLP